MQQFLESFNVGKSCYDILVTQNASQSGLYLVHPPNIVQGPWKVYCDQESEGGGWTVKPFHSKNTKDIKKKRKQLFNKNTKMYFWSLKVFQVRDDVEPHENFMRNWEDYKLGFGDFDREFWLGVWRYDNN